MLPTRILPLLIALGLPGCGASGSDAPRDGSADDAGTEDGAIADAAQDAQLADAGTDAAAPSGLASLLPQSLYDQLFPERNALYTYEALLAAAAYHPAFASTGSVDDRKRELAAFLANVSHETTGGWPAAPGGPYAWGLYFTQEVGCETGLCTQYCDDGNANFPCAPGETYHGRGPIQLSWNYNYGQAGAALGLDLLANPDLVTSDGTVAFRTALWFWMTPQAPKPSCHDVMTGGFTPSSTDLAAGRLPGFGLTIDIINGGIECGYARSASVTDRLGFYDRYTTLLGVAPGGNLDCDSMQPY